MKIEVKIDTASLDKKLSHIQKAISQAVEEAVTKSAYKVEGDAKVNCPVDTSRLRDSIHTEFDFSNNNHVAIIGTDVEYASIIELYGSGMYNPNSSKPNGWVYKDAKGNYRFTKGQQARPFLYPALKQNEQDIKNYIIHSIKSHIK